MVCCVGQGRQSSISATECLTRLVHGSRMVCLVLRLATFDQSRGGRMGGQRLVPRQLLADPGSTLRAVLDGRLFRQPVSPTRTAHRISSEWSKIVAYLRRPDGLLMPLAKMWCSGI